MSMIVREPTTIEEIRSSRAAIGADHHDEVWEGVYVVSPSPNDEHQDIVGTCYLALMGAIGLPKLGRVRPGVNVSDRDLDWTKNYRVPDVAVFLDGTTAVNRNSYWLGGPDFVVEVLSENDCAREKLDFYAKVGVREALYIDRDPWGLELYRLVDGTLELSARSGLELSEPIVSQIVPLTFRLVQDESRPMIEATHTDGVRRWMI
jgi:Uma2 family endonuclease